MGRFLSEFVESKVAVVAALLLFTIIAAALFAPWITPQNPYDLAQVSVLDARMEPGAEASMATPSGWAQMGQGAISSPPSSTACASRSLSASPAVSSRSSSACPLA